LSLMQILAKKTVFVQALFSGTNEILITYNDSSGGSVDIIAPISSITSVPDASVMLLLGSSLMGLAVFSRKSKKN
jgi:hypothetical protein